MTTTEETRYPEHEKQAKVKDLSNAIGEFLDIGLPQQGLIICRSVPEGDNGEPKYVWGPNATDAERGDEPTIGDYMRGAAERNEEYEEWDAHLVPAGKPIIEMLADYFEIDLNKIEAERREMLEALQT